MGPKRAVGLHRVDSVSNNLQVTVARSGGKRGCGWIIEGERSILVLSAVRHDVM